MRLTALWQYPIKSCRGVSLPAGAVDARGLVGDRRWMVVDASWRFLTQRELPRMALVAPAIDGDLLRVEAPTMPPLVVPPRPDGPRHEVTVWDDRVEAIDQGDEAAAWLGAFLETSCRLVRFADDVVRPLDPTYARPDDQTGFADGFPFLLVSEASLADLNARLETPLPMNRFRPNLVVDGVAPFAEDGWTRIRIGALGFRVVKPCARCPITTTDQETAARGKEPLRTLATFRRLGDRGVMFGQNVIHDGEGTLRVGDLVEVPLQPG